MATVGVRDLKNKLSRYVALVKRGERVVVTEHGVPVAMLGPIDREASLKLSLDERLAKMAAEGLVIVGEDKRISPAMPTVVNRGRMLSDIVIDDRR